MKNGKKEQGVCILKKALENFGPKGERWTQNEWFRIPNPALRDEISQGGEWRRKKLLEAWKDPGMEVCSLGSLEVACAQLGFRVHGTAYNAAVTLLAGAMRSHYDGMADYASTIVMDYNDVVVNTFAPIEQKFKKAIERGLE